MQKKNGNVGTMLESLAKLEADVRALRREVSTLVSHGGKRTAARAKRPAFKSLRGIFPASDIAWEDFRDVRASWTRNLGRKP
jgi:hypothetical protein